MIDILLKQIKHLETKIEFVKKNNQQSKELINKILNSSKISKKELISTLKKVLELLEVGDLRKFFNENALNFKAFVTLAKEKKDLLLVLIDAEFEKVKQDYVISYISNKITPIVTIKNNIIYAIIDKNKLKTLQDVNIVPFYNPLNEEFDEIELYKVVFVIEDFNMHQLDLAEEKFIEFRNRPTFRHKHFIVYSLIEDKIIDFEAEEKKKEKEKFSYVYDENYPNLESKLKREYKNIPFVLAVLEKIDMEMDNIKKSRGLINIVNRIFNFIEQKIDDNEIQKMIRHLRKNLKDY